MLTLEELADNFNSIKTLPHVAIRLTKMISANVGTSAEYEKIIRYDPILVMRLFKLVNSAIFSLREKVESINEAMVYIGLDNLRNMVVVEALKDIFKDNIDGAFFSRKKLWLHCVSMAICAKMIAERVFGEKGEDAFLCGLLHDIGIIIEDQAAPELFTEMLKNYDRSMPFIEHEKIVIGVNHCETGFWLSRDWKLPAHVQFGIRDHHFVKDLSDPSCLTGIIQLAELLVTRLGYTALSEMDEDLSESLLLHMRKNIAEYKSIMQDLPKEMKKAKYIYAL